MGCRRDQFVQTGESALAGVRSQVSGVGCRVSKVEGAGFGVQGSDWAARRAAGARASDRRAMVRNIDRITHGAQLQQLFLAGLLESCARLWLRSAQDEGDKLRCWTSEHCGRLKRE